MRALPLTAVTLMIAACGTGPDACTDSVEPAITLVALDGFTGENVTEGAQGTVSEGTFVDSLRPALFEEQRVLRLRAADERPGTYDLFVERDGYQAVSLSGIEVSMGKCHVNTVAMEVTVVPFQ
jgi:hypothetical protein